MHRWRPVVGSSNNINGFDKAGYTQLHWAAVKGDWKEVQRLICVGADPNLLSRSGLSVTKLAKRNPNTKVLCLLKSAKQKHDAMKELKEWRPKNAHHFPDAFRGAMIILVIIAKSTNTPHMRHNT